MTASIGRILISYIVFNIFSFKINTIIYVFCTYFFTRLAQAKYGKTRMCLVAYPTSKCSYFLKILLPILFSYLQNGFGTSGFSIEIVSVLSYVFLFTHEYGNPNFGFSPSVRVSRNKFKNLIQIEHCSVFRFTALHSLSA